MKGKKLSRLLSWMLALVMVVGMVPAGLIVPAAAEEVKSDGYTYGVDDAVAEEKIEKILTSVYMGEYPTGHMQGFAIDDEMKYIYASFTTKLAKVDVETGEVVGVVHNWSGHLGDMAYYDGRVYGSLEYKGANSFYIAVFDCDKIKGDMDYTECMTTMYLPEVSKDYGATIAGEKYAYGCSGIDGVAFGTIPGDKSGEIVMMVAYGIFTDASTDVQDRDYQVLLQYDLSSFLESDGQGGTKIKDECNDILNQSNHHKKGPEHEDKYFVYTGNTNYGIQNLEYDAKSGNYCMAVYTGSCPEFPNYGIYYLDGSKAAEVQDLIMAPERFEAYKALPNSNPGCTHMAEGKVLQLADNNGSSDGSATLTYQECNPGFGVSYYRIWGSNQVGRNPSTGLDHIYGDYFYISQSGGGLTGGQIGYAHLYKYDRDNDTFTAIVREVPPAPAKKLLSYSMDAADLYTEDGVTYMKNGVSNGYDAVVEGTAPSVGVDGTAAKSLFFNGWNYPADPDQLYLDEETIDYINSEFGKAGYSYSYSFWAKMATGTNTDGNFQPIVGLYREDGTYISVFEQRWRTQMKTIVNGVGTAGPGSANAGTEWAKNVGNPTTANPGDGGTYITNPDNLSGAGGWIFYTITEKNGSVVIYENGVQTKTYSTTANHFAAEPVADFIIGGGSAKLWLDMNNRGRLIGSVDDVTIYSGVLTADEVAAEYAKVTTKETSGVPTITAADKAEAPSNDVVYLTWDLTADAGQDLVMEVGAPVAGLQIPGLTAGTDYVAEGTKVTVKAAWLAAQEPGKIEVSAGGLNVCLTITNVKVPLLSYSLDKADVSNGSVKDGSVYGVDAIANNIDTFNQGRTGVANGSAFFNGHDYKNPTYIKLAADDAAWLNSVLTDGYTINFWAKAQAENGNKMVFAGLYGDDARPLGVVETYDSESGNNNHIDGVLTVQASAAKAGTQTAQNARAASVAEVDEWAMYTASYDKESGLLKLYVNGALLASTPADDDILGEISQLFIGHQYKKYYYSTATQDWTTRGGFYGLMDNFEVYGYALSQEEIEVLAGGGAIQPAIKTDPVIHWTMDAETLNQDGTMTDKSKNDLTSYFANVTPVEGVDGKENGALYFDGSSDADEFSRVWLSDEGIKTLNEKIGDKITVAFWMKPDFASRGENYPYTGTWTPVGGVFGESDHRFLMVAEYRYGQMTYCAQSGGDKHIPGLGASNWKDDQWYYVVMTYDSAVTEQIKNSSGTLTNNSYHRLYIMTPDGTVNEYAGSRPFVSTTLYDKITHLEFGGQYAKGHWTDTNVRGRYIGAIDDIKVYNVAVNKDDVAKLAANRPVTVAGTYTAPEAPAPAETYFEPAVLTFDKTAPADVTFTAKDGFGTVASIAAEDIFEDEYTISGKSVTIKADYLMQQQPGAVTFTVTPANGTAKTVTVYVTNPAPTATNPAGEMPYPVLYYPMDKDNLTSETAVNGVVSGTIADASGNGLNLISTGITTTGADKNNTANAATWFDSYRDHNISYAALDQDGMDAFKALVDDEITFSFWHKSDRISSNYMPVLGLYAEDDRPVLLAEFYAGTGGERGGKGQTTTPAFTATPDNSVTLAEGSLRAGSAVTMNNTWHHYVMTYNNTTGAAVLYVDGAKAGEATLSAGQLDDAASFEIGALANADYYNVGASTGRDTGMSLFSHGRLHGYLDEVKVYNVALTADDVTALYTVGVGGDLAEDLTGNKDLESIAITADPKTTYAVGDALDVTGGKVTLTFKDKTTKEIDLTADMVTGFDSALGKELTLTVSYTHKGITKTAQYTVTIVKKLESIAVTTLPKTEYLTQETLDVTGGKVTLTYDDDTTQIIDLTAAMVSGFTSENAADLTLTVTYEGKTATYAVTVAKELKSIAVTTAPKTIYSVGEALDVAGGKVTLTYHDNTTEEIDLTAEMVSGFDSALGKELTLTVTYEGKTAAYNVAIVKELESIAVTTLPKTKYLPGEELDVAGGKVTLTYDDATTEEIDLTADMVTGFASQEEAALTLTVTYQNLTDTYAVVVKKAGAVKYAVTLGEFENGTVALSSKTASAGDAVTVTAKADEGYELADLTVTDSNGNAIKVTKTADGKYTFVMPNKAVTIAPVFAEDAGSHVCPSEKFDDVDTSLWYHEAVDFVVTEGLMTGVSADDFAPNATTTRGMIVTILYSLEGKPAVTGDAFDDVNEGDWYFNAVNWAAANGIVSGYGDDKFGPNDNVTREQLVAILKAYAAYKKADVAAAADLAAYADADAISAWAVEAVKWGVAEGIISGKSADTLDPAGNALRCEVAQMMFKFTGLI